MERLWYMVVHTTNKIDVWYHTTTSIRTVLAGVPPLDALDQRKLID